MAYKLIIGVRLPYLWAPYLWIFNQLDFVILITWKLVETNSQSFWGHGHF